MFCPAIFLTITFPPVLVMTPLWMAALQMLEMEANTPVP